MAPAVRTGFEVTTLGTHCSKQHIHQDPGATQWIVNHQLSTSGLRRQPIGKIPAGMFQAVTPQHLGDFRKLRTFANDDMDEGMTLIVRFFIDVDHEDFLQHDINRRIFFRRAGKVEHHLPVRGDDGEKQIRFGRKETIEGLL